MDFLKCSTENCIFFFLHSIYYILVDYHIFNSKKTCILISRILYLVCGNTLTRLFKQTVIVQDCLIFREIEIHFNYKWKQQSRSAYEVHAHEKVMFRERINIEITVRNIADVRQD